MTNPLVNIEMAALSSILKKAATIKNMTSRDAYLNTEIELLKRRCSPIMYEYITKKLEDYNQIRDLQKKGN
jgi:hypothetical protein